MPYVHRIAVAFFGNLVETSVEFRKAFAGLPAMSSSFLTWLEEEVHFLQAPSVTNNNIKYQALLGYWVNTYYWASQQLIGRVSVCLLLELAS